MSSLYLIWFSIQGNIITGACNGLDCKSGEFYFAILGNSFCNTVPFNYAINTADDPFMFKKYLNRGDPKKSIEPYYECQFCGTIHKGYYANGGQSIDFRPLNRK